MHEVFIPFLIIFFYLLRYCSRHFSYLPANCSQTHWSVSRDYRFYFSGQLILSVVLQHPQSKISALYYNYETGTYLMFLGERSIWKDQQLNKASTLKPSVTMTSNFVLAQSSTTCKLFRLFKFSCFGTVLRQFATVPRAVMLFLGHQQDVTFLTN